MRSKPSGKKQRNLPNPSPPIFRPRAQLPDTFYQALSQLLHQQKDFLSLCVLAQTSKSLHKTVTPHIYETLVISRRNEGSVFAGLKVSSNIEVSMGRFQRDLGWSESDVENEYKAHVEEAENAGHDGTSTGRIHAPQPVHPGPDASSYPECSFNGPASFRIPNPYQGEDQGFSEKCKLELKVSPDLASFDFSYFTSDAEYHHHLPCDNPDLPTPDNPILFEDPLGNSYAYPPWSNSPADFYPDYPSQTPQYNECANQDSRRDTSNPSEVASDYDYIDWFMPSHPAYPSSRSPTPYSSMTRLDDWSILSHPAYSPSRLLTSHSNMTHPDLALSTVTTNLSSKTSKPRRQSLARYPNNPSHARKLEAFRHVKTIILDDLPSKKIGIHVQSWAKIRTANKNGFLFPSLDTLIIEDQAVYGLAEWSERHGGRSHPFAGALKYAISPKKVCVTFPTMTSDYVNRFCNARKLSERANDMKKIGRKALTRKVLMRWYDFQNDGVSNTIASLINGWRVGVEELVLHNIVNQRIVGVVGGRLRICFEGCACFRQEERKVTGCIDHITGIGRMKRLLLLLKGREGKEGGKGIELVNLDSVGSRDLKPHEVAPLFLAGGVLQKAIQILSVPTGVNGCLKVICVCCGKTGG